jgi:hypothetical protein
LPGVKKKPLLPHRLKTAIAQYIYQLFPEKHEKSSLVGHDGQRAFSTLPLAPRPIPLFLILSLQGRGKKG